MQILRDKSYDETVDILVEQPRIQDMAFDMRESRDEDFMTPEGKASWTFAAVALDQFRDLGGRLNVHAHATAVGEAIVKIRKREGRCFLPPWIVPYVSIIDEGELLVLLIKNEEFTVEDIQRQHPTGWAQFRLLCKQQRMGMLAE